MEGLFAAVACTTVFDTVSVKAMLSVSLGINSSALNTVEKNAVHV